MTNEYDQNLITNKSNEQSVYTNDFLHTSQQISKNIEITPERRRSNLEHEYQGRRQERRAQNRQSVIDLLKFKFGSYKDLKLNLAKGIVDKEETKQAKAKITMAEHEKLLNVMNEYCKDITTPSKYIIGQPSNIKYTGLILG